MTQRTPKLISRDKAMEACASLIIGIIEKLQAVPSSSPSETVCRIRIEKGGAIETAPEQPPPAPAEPVEKSTSPAG